MFNLNKLTLFWDNSKGKEDTQFRTDGTLFPSDYNILLYNCSPKDNHEFAIVRENIRQKLDVSN